MNLDIKKWKDFKVSSIFTIHNGKGITKEEIEENPGDFTVVQSGEENNGVLGKIDRNYCEAMNYTLSYKPCLTVARSGSAGFVSFQIDGCVVGDSAKILLLDEEIASNEVYTFLQTILSANRFKYAYGRKVTESKYMNDTIKLPIAHNADGSPFIDISKKYSEKGYVPDWIWMENYIKSLNYKTLTTTNNKQNTIELNLNKWQSFEIKSILKVINGKGLTAEEIEENPGDIFCIQGGETKNGSIGCINRGYCEKQGYVIIDEMCLTVARVGTAGCVNFWEDSCAIGDKCKGLILKEHQTKAAYLFIQTILNQLQYKYSYGRGLVTDKYMSDIIMLPILYNIDGSPFIDDKRKYSKRGYVPDWNFMENYIKSLPYGDRI